jgi:thiamine biosynthesis lipoprotein
MELTRRALLSLRRPLPPARTPGFWLHLHREAMACRFEVTLPSELAGCTDAAHASLDIVDRLEEQLSIFRPQSELARINTEASAHAVPVEPRLFDLLARCRDLHARTDGAFDVTATPLSQIWGFLRRQGRIPTADQLAEARACVGMQHVQLDRPATTVRFTRPGVALNLGGIGKGYALDRAARPLRDAGATALLTSGSSSMLAVGAGPDGAGFTVGLRDPFAHGRRLGTVRLRDAALGVSGVSEQSFTHEGRRYGHIIDPRNGWPVEGRAYVAVIAPNAALADALATAFFVGGPGLAERIIEKTPAVTALLVDMPLSGESPAPVVVGDPSAWSQIGAH